MRNLVREKLYNLYYSQNVVSVNISWRGMRDRERAWEIMGEHGRDMKLKGPLGRLSKGWENEITVELKETGHK